MRQEWRDLTKMTDGQAIIIEKVRIPKTGVAVEGQFELPPLANLSAEDQMFVASFIKCHGSIKEMEKLFGVSYPTIKNRLNRIAKSFDFINLNIEEPVNQRESILKKLDNGEITAKQAVELLRS